MNSLKSLYNSCRDAFECYPLCKYYVGVAAVPLIVTVHEAAHAVAAQLLYQNANPVITLRNYGYEGGSCSYTSTSLSKFGEWLGEPNAESVVFAAGPVVQMVASLALLRFFPGNFISFVALMRNATYALSALDEKAFYTGSYKDLKSGHDFVNIRVLKGDLAAGALMISSIACGAYTFYSTFPLLVPLKSSTSAIEDNSGVKKTTNPRRPYILLTKEK
jgi:hypothetical protein